VIGWVKTRTGSFTDGLLVGAASLAAAALLVLCLPKNSAVALPTVHSAILEDRR
jgi:hypothetical protein